MVLFGFFVSLPLFGQLIWASHIPNNIDDTRKLLKTKTGGYAIFHEEVTEINGIGKEVCRFDNEDLFFFEIDEVYDAAIFPDSTIAIETYSYGVDMPSGEAWAYSTIIKLDNACNVVQLAKDFIFPEYGDIEPLSDGSFALLYDYSKIALKDVNGETIWIKNLTGYETNDFLISALDSIMIATKQGLLSMDKLGNIASIHPNLIFEEIKRNDQGWIVGKSGDSLTVLSGEYQMNGQLDLTDEGVKDYAIKDDTLAILANSNQVKLLTTSMSLISEFQLTGNERYKFIELSNGKVALSGETIFGDESTNKISLSSFVKEYWYDGTSPNNEDDIGIVGMDLGSNAIIQEYGTLPTYHVTMPDTKIVVRNFGTVPVNKFYIRNGTFLPEFFETTIQPGEEITVPLPTLRFYTTVYPTGSTFEVCTWSSNPNLGLDADNSNDLFCTDFLVGTNEKIPSGMLALYPNPASNSLNVKINGHALMSDGHIRIIDITGRQILNSGLKIRDNFTIPVQDWPSGMYFLQYLEDGALQAVERFVIVH